MILKRKAIRSLMAILIVIGCIASSFVMATAENQQTVSNPEEHLTGDELNAADSYTTYLSKYKKSAYSSVDIKKDLGKKLTKDEPISFEFNVEKDGLYYIGMSYKALDEKNMEDINIGLKIDGVFPYANMAELSFPRMWCDKKGANNTDAFGNEYVPEQVLLDEYYYNETYDEVLEATERFMVHLSAGKHTAEIIANKGEMDIEYFKFAATTSAKKYSAPNKNEIYNGKTIVIEAEKAYAKSSYFLAGSAEQGSLDITPVDVEKRLINYIGKNWSTVGDTIVWKTPNIEKAGYYQLGFSFRQNSVIGSKTYRSLKINGQSPFKEAENIGFQYDDSWQVGAFADQNNKPYLVYLEKGVNTISLTVTASDMSSVRTQLTEAVAMMGDLYIDITKITGETVDVYRDYELFRQIGDMQERLTKIKNLLDKSSKDLLKITGETSGSNYSVIQNMLQTVNQMLENKYESHKYKSTYYNNYCAVSSVLLDLRSMPLQLDKISLSAPNAQMFEEHGFFEELGFSTKRFIWSFIDDYNMDEEDENSITIWINWGRDQAQVLSALIDRKFTPQYNIKVNLKLVNASIIQAVLSGKGPDVVLQHGRTEPVNLAMRGVLYDLTKFDNYEEILDRFQEGADNPYWYKGGLYGLPDTQSFPVLFYRKDILPEYNIPIPGENGKEYSWDDFQLATKLLMRNNMNVCMPASTSTDSLFPTLLLQNGKNLYKKDGSATTMLESDSAEIFEQWTNYYTKLKVPISMDFYNRFRTGTTPLGISAYTLYTTLKVAAPEIDGLWGFTTIPGTVVKDKNGNPMKDENGNEILDHTAAGTGTACSILQMAADNGREKNAWKFLDWWTSAETQLNYSNDIETILGPSGRVAVSNKEALESLSWDDEDLAALKKAREHVTEVPEYPGSYYVQRAIYQAYWNVVSNGKNTKDMMMKFGTEANNEIARKWKQYTNRG